MPTNFDLTDVASYSQLTASTQTNGSPTSSEIDVGSAQAQMLVLEVESYTDGTHQFQLEGSDTSGSNFSQVASNLKSGDAVPTVSGTGDTGTYHLGYIGNERFLRLNTTSGSGTTGATYSVHGVTVPDREPAN